MFMSTPGKSMSGNDGMSGMSGKEGMSGRSILISAAKTKLAHRTANARLIRMILFILI